jgi:hypothetical protein
MTEWLEVSESVSDMDARRLGRALNASRSGIMIKTCWQTTSDGMNLYDSVRIDDEVLKLTALTIQLVRRIC